MKKQLKLVAFTVVMLIAGIANAQQESDFTTGNKNVQTGKDKTVRVIDNKGTIKYLQVSNGITAWTNETTDRTTTTWQLGGTLSTNTTISFGTGSTSPTFTLDGEAFALENIATVSSTAADGTPVSVTSATSSPSNPAGWTFLVRDEQTGEVRKILASDALKVTSTHNDVTVGSGGVTTTSLTTSTQGVELAFRYPNTTIASYSKVQVYRNGAKLRANTDYMIANPASGNSRIYLITNTTAPNDWELYNDDTIEIHAFR